MDETETTPDQPSPREQPSPQEHLSAEEQLSTENGLSIEVAQRAPREGAELLDPLPDAVIIRVLERLNPSVAQQVLDEFPDDRRQAIFAAAPAEIGRQWALNETYGEDTVGRLMDPPIAVFPPDATIEETIGRLRELVKKAFITYGFVTDDERRLLGVIVMRDLLFGGRNQRLREIMIRDPFYLRPETALTDAMKQVLNRHYPVYPVADETKRLVGTVRGQSLFEAHAIEISAQPGTMVGVEKEERLSTSWARSLRLRHPWLQLNLLTAFLAAGVVAFFQHTIDRIIVLAVFLTVLSGQSANTGCQAMAVALRALTLGELKAGREKILVLKEGLIGLLNGALVGVSGAVAMYLVASLQKHPAAAVLAFVVFVAMTGSCVVSGVFGALIPLGLRKLGADPAMASSIFLTTVSDVTSMGLFLGLATWLVR
jgi:magnesium transporter